MMVGEDNFAVHGVDGDRVNRIIFVERERGADAGLDVDAVEVIGSVGRDGGGHPGAFGQRARHAADDGAVICEGAFACPGIYPKELPTAADVVSIGIHDPELRLVITARAIDAVK